MLENLIDRINRGVGPQLFSFFLLWFATYGAAWTVLEPLGLQITPEKLNLWRYLFIGSTFLITICVFFFVLFRKKLEHFGLEAGNTDLIGNLVFQGSPEISIQNDGFHGRIYTIKANYSKDPMDWNVKASSHKAKYLTLIYKPDPDLMFYARVSMLSKNKKGASYKWLRFEPNTSLPQSITDNEEMGVPVTASDDNGLFRIHINIAKTVNNAFGVHGWKYEKLMKIRARGSGKIKSIILK